MRMSRPLDACGRYLARPGVRFAIVALALALAFAVVTRKLVQVQLHPDPDRIVVPGVVTNVLAATRGGLYDRHGRRHPLAESFPLWKVAIDPLAVSGDDARLAAYRALAGSRCPATTRASPPTARSPDAARSTARRSTRRSCRPTRRSSAGTAGSA